MLDPKQVKGSLYDPSFEQDSCGVGFVARPSASPGRDIVELALEAVANLTHRGAVDADAKTGDGAGILVQLPRRFLLREARKLGLRLANADALAVAMVFLPRKTRHIQRAPHPGGGGATPRPVRPGLAEGAAGPLGVGGQGAGHLS